MNIDVTNDMSTLYNTMDKSILHKINPVFLITITIILVFYYLVFASLPGQVNSVQTSEGTFGLSIIELFLWAMFIFLLLINGLQYFFELDIQAIIKGLFSPNPEIDIKITQPQIKSSIPEITWEKQVFHIPENTYTYDDAKALCNAYGARLANYDEVEKAYNKGGEWCSYGWSDDQLILYPTQKKTYDRLKHIKGHENDCGRPGINGGFIGNPNAKFGVNCYGYKPEITSEERNQMNNIRAIPITQREKELEKKVAEYRKDLPNIMIAPFNNKRWSLI